MNTQMRILAGMAFAAVLSLSSTSATHAADILTLKPLQGVSVHHGNKHAVVYFLKQKGACELVVTSLDGAEFEPARYEATIEAGTSAHYDLAEGKLLEFVCQADASAMSLKVLDQVAASPPGR